MPPRIPTGTGGTGSSLGGLDGIDDPAWMPREIKSTLPPLKLTLPDDDSSGRWVPPKPKPDVDLSSLQSADIPGGLYVALDSVVSSNNRSQATYNTFGPGRAGDLVGQQLELESDKGKFKDDDAGGRDTMMWMPREIPSTLPPLKLEGTRSKATGSTSNTMSRAPLPAGPAVADRSGSVVTGKAQTTPTFNPLSILDEALNAYASTAMYDPSIMYDIPTEDRGVYITMAPLAGGGKNDFGTMAGTGVIGGTIELYEDAKGDTTDADWARAAQAKVGWRTEVAKVSKATVSATAPAADEANAPIPALPPPWAVPVLPGTVSKRAAATSSSSSSSGTTVIATTNSQTPSISAPASSSVLVDTLIPVELPTTLPPLRLEVPKVNKTLPGETANASGTRPALPAGSAISTAKSTSSGGSSGTTTQPKTVPVMPFDAVNHDIPDFDRGVYIALAPLTEDPEDGLGAATSGDTFGGNYGQHLVGRALEMLPDQAANSGKGNIGTLREQVEREARAREDDLNRAWSQAKSMSSMGAIGYGIASAADAVTPYAESSFTPIREIATTGSEESTMSVTEAAAMAGFGDVPRGLYVPVNPGNQMAREAVSMVGTKIFDDDGDLGVMDSTNTMTKSEFASGVTKSSNTAVTPGSSAKPVHESFDFPMVFPPPPSFTPPSSASKQSSTFPTAQITNVKPPLAPTTSFSQSQNLVLVGLPGAFVLPEETIDLPGDVQSRGMYVKIGGDQGDADGGDGLGSIDGAGADVSGAVGRKLSINVTGMDHIVLNVSDVEVSLKWYKEKLGLKGVRVEEWRAGKVPFPSVRLSNDTIIDFFSHRTAPGATAPVVNDPRNLNHFCLVVEPTRLSNLITSGHFLESEIVQPPCRRFGARGDGTSLYVRDPDGNEVEVRYYPWNPDDVVVANRL
ncbi:hypothetical protein HDU93_004422 [Gonapodya sp. JEL0774]|nr:hypothetical protein HDU93_004422 [Gonapodya sp. JEL0774]